MKRTVFLILSFCLTISVFAQATKSIRLGEPSASRKTDVMKAFQNRQSTNEYQSKDLSLQDLSDLLWAANGINRPQNGKKTAPSAMNSQDIDVYVCRADGVYLYDAAKQVAKKIYVRL